MLSGNRVRRHNPYASWLADLVFAEVKSQDRMAGWLGDAMPSAERAESPVRHVATPDFPSTQMPQPVPTDDAAQASCPVRALNRDALPFVPAQHATPEDTQEPVRDAPGFALKQVALVRFRVRDALFWVPPHLVGHRAPTDVVVREQCVCSRRSADGVVDNHMLTDAGTVIATFDKPPDGRKVGTVLRVATPEDIGRRDWLDDKARAACDAVRRMQKHPRLKEAAKDFCEAEVTNCDFQLVDKGLQLIVYFRAKAAKECDITDVKAMILETFRCTDGFCSYDYLVWMHQTNRYKRKDKFRGRR